MLAAAPLEFAADGTPWSTAYGDVYHARQGGPAQARHVFLAGNGLPERWQDRPRFTILETGFGLGLNFLATWAAWRADSRACRRLHFVSLEKHPFTAADLARAQSAWPEFAPLAAELQAAWPCLVPGVHRLRLADGRLLLTLVFGDAPRELRRLMLAADAFYLDGFAPERNPELWSPDVCRALARLAAPGATLASWCVRGALRTALAAHEFAVERRPGFAGKRHMLVGHYRSRKPHPYPLPGETTALVIGAGVAGSSAAAALAERGWTVTVLERAAAAGQGASGNLAGVLRPHPSIDDNPLARLTRAGFLAARAQLARLEKAGLPVRWGTCGVLQLARDAEHEARQLAMLAHLAPPPEFARPLDREAASAHLGWPVPRGGCFFPLGGWVMPPSLCRAQLALAPERLFVRYGSTVARIARQDAVWQAFAADGRLLGEAPHLVLAVGVDLPSFAPAAWLPQSAARGQVTWLPAAATPPLDRLVCGQGYVTPVVDGLRVVGATHQENDPETRERPSEHAANLAQLDRLLPGFAAGLSPEGLRGRVGFRPMSPDRLPIVGPVPAADGRRGRHAAPLPGLWCMQGFGARGIVWSALMADLLASRMHGEPLPLTHDLVTALAPQRFLPL
jgi:tRNA 5-methylaminomethyl-2-thiouridine biosynthesis bifunctional protein